MEKTTRNRIGCLGLIFGPIILFFVILIANRPTPEQEAARASERNGYTAARYCQDAVRARLKSPAGAEFQVPRHAAITELDNGNYKISSYVDAQNSFGATLRTPFTCLVSGREVIELEMDGR